MKATGMKMGSKACVQSMDMDATEKRRLMDMGICTGVEIERVLNAPLGGTIAFRVRGTVLALRDELTDKIEVAPCKN